MEQRLAERAHKDMQSLQGIRSAEVDDIFDQRLYIAPSDLAIENYLRRTPASAFNPGALVRDGGLVVFPRLIFDYCSYTSSVGMFEIDVAGILKGEVPAPLSTRIVLWPTETWEFGSGCEDPRVALWDQEIYMLYTAANQCHDEETGHYTKPIQGIARFSYDLKLRSRGYFTVAGEGEPFVPAAKDSALLPPVDGKAVLLWRPHIGDLAVCWRGETDLTDYLIAEKSIIPVLAAEEWESRVGWSTNVVPLDNARYLVGWHGVSRIDQAYRNGLATVDDEGYVTAVSDYLLAPQGLHESYGDRPHTLFGNGLVLHDDHLIWVGGISDYAIGIFSTPVERALERLRKL